MQVKAQETESVFVSVFFMCVLEGTAGFKSVVWTALLLYKWQGHLHQWI